MPSNTILFNTRNVDSVELFTTFYDEELLQEVWDAGNSGGSNVWTRHGGDKRINSGECDFGMLYRVLAVKIFIQGQTVIPYDVLETGRPLREMIKRAKDRYPLAPGIETIERILSHLLLTSDHTDHLSRNFRSIVKCVGESVACDEKLFYFTGNSGNFRLVISKPKKKGIWFYQQIGTTPNGKSYLLDLDLWEVLKEYGQVEHVTNVVKDWCDNIVQMSEGKLPVLAFDSYYASKPALDHLQEHGFRFVGSVGLNCFEPLQYKVRHHVTKPGQWAGLYSEEEKMLYVLYWDRDEQIGKKQVLTTAYKHYPGYLQQKQLIPGYDLYKLLFAACDHYNQQLDGHTWPFKHGGHGRLGDLGAEDDFAFSCLLQNVYNVVWAINKLGDNMMKFKPFCEELADGVYSYATGYD
jgi:hypothetical protein